MRILGCGGEHSVFPKTSFWELDFLGKLEEKFFPKWMFTFPIKKQKA
jgi:hypothetical protein